jgi:hypothetical protein
MKTTIGKLKHLIKETVTMNAADHGFWKRVEENNEVVGWDEAQQHMPADVAAAFQQKLIDDDGYDPDDFEFAYEPITHFRDKYGEEEASGEEEDDTPYFTAYAAVSDELWHWNGSEWMLYNY